MVSWKRGDFLTKVKKRKNMQRKKALALIFRKFGFRDSSSKRPKGKLHGGEGLGERR